MTLQCEAREAAGNESPGACQCALRGASTEASRLSLASTSARDENLVYVPGGDFLMGSDKFYREERPLRRASVEPFWMDRYPVTNAEFARFVQATGYITVAERAPDPAHYPDADPALLVPGSVVFQKPAGPVSLRDHRAWWSYVPGASWRHPQGPESSIDGREDHPVVHVNYEDASAYATFVGKSLPTEAEWEFAARGGLEQATYPWGEEFLVDGELMANVWIGRFPWENLKPKELATTSPVGKFPANGYGLYDVVGNVWEWTTSLFDLGATASSCCGGAEEDSLTPRRVVKGGSHLCAPAYCFRYRPAARQGQTTDTSTSHIGFRCVLRNPVRHRS